MKISIVCPDLSSNGLGRAYLLAKVLQRRYEVEIIGFKSQDKIWEPVCDDKSIVYKSVKIGRGIKPYWQIIKLVKMIKGDVIYVHKALPASFLPGLFKKIFARRPLILDIDDWELGLIKYQYKNISSLERFKLSLVFKIAFYRLDSYWNRILCEKLTGLADKVTVSNNFLQKKFGGTIIRHGRDGKAFNPAKFDPNLIRQKYQIKTTKKVIMFFGTPRRYKGIEDLIQAVESIKNENLLLILVGINKKPYSQNLVKSAQKKLNTSFKEFGLQPFEKVPEFLSMADIIVIPQRKNLATIGQTPAKVFDAMAMAKPIIATYVSDLPKILDDCGLIAKPNNPHSLAKAIRYLLDNPTLAKMLGVRARQKFLKKYTWEIAEKQLSQIFDQYQTRK